MKLGPILGLDKSLAKQMGFIVFAMLLPTKIRPFVNHGLGTRHRLFLWQSQAPKESPEEKHLRPLEKHLGVAARQEVG